MQNGICYIICAGDNYGLDFGLNKDDYVIAVDGGFRYLKEAKINADLVIGDFDALGVVPCHPNVITLNQEKDETDTLAAISEGIKLGYRIFHIFCGTGGRIDHTIANIQLLSYLSQNQLKGILFCKNTSITAITNGSLRFSDKSTGTISVFSSSEISRGVSLKGLKYELDHATIRNIFPLGVSNEFTGKESTIMVKKGTLLVTVPTEVVNYII